MGVAPCHASETEEFEAAKAVYDAGDFSVARDLFLALVDPGSPKVTSKTLVIESYKYLAAISVFMNEGEKADHYCRQVLNLDPEHQIDALAFPQDVVRRFETIQTQEREARAQIEREREAQTRVEDETVRQRRELMQRLLSAAEEPMVEIEHARWPMFVPFGVGQFDHGNDGLGAFFLSGELLCLGLGLGSMIYHQSIIAFLAQNPDLGQDARSNRNQHLNAAWITGWTSNLLFLSLMVVGIVEANLSYKPTRTVRGKQRLSPELKERTQLSFSLLAPMGFSLTF